MWHPKYQFPERLKSASVDEKMAYFKKGFVLNHVMIKRVHDHLKSDFFDSSEQQIVLVEGPTGVGKSCLANTIFSDFYRGRENEGSCKTLPIVYFEADVHSAGSFSWKDFYVRMLRAIGELEEIRIYGTPLPVGDDGGRKYSARNRTEHQLRGDFERRLSDYDVGYILFDEIQHVFKYGGKSAERNLDILKNISNKTGCRFIGLGTYEISFSIDKSAQLSRRIMSLEFPGYSIASNEDYQSFLSAYSGLLAYMPVQMSADVSRYAKEAYIGSCGCVGILKEWFNRALRRALVGGEGLNSGHFQATRLKGSQLKPIAEEIREGKAFFSEPDDSEIMTLLGVDDSIVMEAPSSKSSGKKVRPGIRKPVRDAVV